MRTVVVALSLLALFGAGCTKTNTGLATPRESSRTTVGATPASTAVPLPTPSGPVTDKGHVDDTNQGANVSLEINAADNYFTPTFVEVAPGATVHVTVKDTGIGVHTFTIPGTNTNIILNPGQSGAATFTLPQTGFLTFICSYHQALGMQGAFYVP
ncbi:MAG TPA: cupredoxin domain-containing protein [Actinomycetota bacterium]|nr:cupredoxin domain-containing protein [Actinomycetota bacterium]